MTHSPESENLPEVAEKDTFYLGQTSSDLQPRDETRPDVRRSTLPADRQAAFSFALRGMALNPIVDCASPMIALMLRMSNLGNFNEIDDLHKRCKHEIEAIELELHKLGYDRTTILTFRYCLCSVLDEAVMISPWGMNSRWSENSLLAIYHEETWGGEKFFIIVERLMMEPHRYLDIIEFLYLCMVLGYEGKYRPQHNGRLNLEAFMKEVHDVIRKERGYPETLQTFHGDNIVEKAHHVKWQTPVGVVVLSALVLAIIIYLLFFLYTEGYTHSIINELTDVLKG